MKLQEDIFTSLFYVNQQLDLLVNLSKYTVLGIFIKNKYFPKKLLPHTLLE